MTVSVPPQVFKPRFLPRGVLDFAITTLVALPLQCIGLFVAPAAGVLLAFGSVEGALLAAFLVYLLFLLFSVWSISVSNDGIQFKRILGWPRLLAWSEVATVAEVPRWELIRQGWLWPIFPAREMTACLSSLRHYKITWRGGHCYFPPSDPESRS